MVLGEDVWNTAPILALTLRQAAVNVPAAAAMKQKRINRWEDAALREAIHDKKGPFFVASVEPTELDEVAMECFRAAPRDIARLGFAVAHELDPAAPDVDGLSDDNRLTAQRIARAFMLSEKPLVVSGCGLGSPEIIQAAANITRALKAAGKSPRISFVFPEANSLALAMMASGGIESARKALTEKAGAALVIAEGDLFHEVSAETADSLLAAARFVVVLDHTANGTTEKAHVLLPSSTYAESSGTLVSLEGRAQRFFAVFPPVAPAREGWSWLGELAAFTGKRAAGWESLDALLAEIATGMPELAQDTGCGPAIKLPRGGAGNTPKESPGNGAHSRHCPHQPPRAPARAGRRFPAGIHHGRHAPAAAVPLIPRFWSPGWNSDQSLNKFQIEVGGPLRGGDAGVRILEPRTQAGGAYFPASPPAPAGGPGTLLLVARHHVFGSEELSALSRGIASRTPAPYLAMSAADAKALGLGEGGKALVTVQDGKGTASATLTVLVRDLPPGSRAFPGACPECRCGSCPPGRG